VKLDAKPLSFWVEKQKALPNWRQRWCTRLIKIEPCVRYMKSLPERPTLCVGLRSDEEERKGLYDDCAEYRYPLRERGMDKAAVISICKQEGLMPPARTDCALCFAQRLSEWRELWREHPERYAKGEAWEAEIGHTLRSPGRDSWPAPLSELRKRFESGYLPRGATDQLDLIDDDQYEDEGPCRVCRL
jgi:hypothetical protein